MSKIAKATIGLMMATILSKVLGFIRELVLASAYGATMYSDAYITAMNIPLVIFAIIGSALTTTFIPIYFSIDNKLGKKSSIKFTNNILNIMLVICLLLAVIGFIFVKPLVKIFAIGFNSETFEISVKYTRILIIGVVFIGISYIMTSYLQAKNRFNIPGFISIPKNIIIVISIILSIKYGPDIMVWGTCSKSS